MALGPGSVSWGEDLLPAAPKSLLGTDRVGVHGQWQPERAPRSFRMYIRVCMCVCIYIYIFTYLLFLTEIKCTGLEFIPLCSKLLGPPALAGFTPSGLPPGSPRLAVCSPPPATPQWERGHRDEERGHTPPQVTRRRAYLNATSFLTLRT